MARKKTRLNAKEVQKTIRKSEDSVKVPDQVMSWFQSRRQWFLAVGIGLIVVLVLVWGFSSYEQVRERRAQMHYAHTLGRLANQQNPDAQAWAPVIAELKSLCEQYRGTRAARTARASRGFDSAGERLSRLAKSHLWACGCMSVQVAISF